MTPDHDKPLTPAQARQKLQEGLENYLAGNGTGSVVFRLKRTKKASETYPLKLTQLQRETLLRLTQLSRNLKNKIKQAAVGTQVVPVTWNELHKLNDQTGEAAGIARNVDKKRLIAVMDRVIKFFEEEHAEIFDFQATAHRRRRPAMTDLLYQFKITLVGSNPPIWRRIQVTDGTLDDLHEHIQSSMGRTNSHLHDFRIGEQRYGDPMLMEEDMVALNYMDSTCTNISEITPKSGERLRFRYEYDFGDGWEHEILFEGCPEKEPGQKYPLCLEGALACPPDDVGGISGYYRFLQARANPAHESHAEYIRWGGKFDPNTFDAKQATQSMIKGLPNWRV